MIKTALLAIVVLWLPVVHVQQKFEVVSIKPCERVAAPIPGQRGGGGGGRNFTVSPGRLVVNCMTLMDMIELGYRPVMESLNTQIGSVQSRIRGGPDWIRSDKFLIEAKADADQDRTVTTGPMLRGILEDKFQLKLREEIEQGPIYALTVAKSGLKVKPAADCVPDPRPSAPGGPPNCGEGLGLRPTGSSLVLESERISLSGRAGLTAWLTTLMDRPVIDRTGLSGYFTLHLEFAPDDSTPGNEFAPFMTSSGPSLAPSIFTAIQEQLGLKLESARGSVGYVVIDRAVKP